MRVLLDIDEVIADFVGGALKVHGWTRAELEAVWEPGTWSIVEPMGLTKETFWAPILKAGPDFWEELDVLPWAAELIATVVSKTKDWWLVTSPGRGGAAAHIGKEAWIKQRFGDFKRFVVTRHKELSAKPGVVLIDDNAATVQKFVDAGGHGIVFPSRHNYLWPYADNAIAFVEDHLNGI